MKTILLLGGYGFIGSNILKFGNELRTLEDKPYWKNTDVFNLAAAYLN